MDHIHMYFPGVLLLAFYQYIEKLFLSFSLGKFFSWNYAEDFDNDLWKVESLISLLVRVPQFTLNISK